MSGFALSTWTSILGAQAAGSAKPMHERRPRSSETFIPSVVNSFGVHYASGGLSQNNCGITNDRVETMYVRRYHLIHAKAAPCFPSEALAWMLQTDARPTKLSSAVKKRQSVLQTDSMSIPGCAPAAMSKCDVTWSLEKDAHPVRSYSSFQRVQCPSTENAVVSGTHPLPPSMSSRARRPEL